MRIDSATSSCQAQHLHPMRVQRDVYACVHCWQATQLGARLVNLNVSVEQPVTLQALFRTSLRLYR